MAGVLHPQPYPIHFFKKDSYGLFPFRLIRIHLPYRAFLFFADPLPQLLNQVPDTSMADGLAAGITDHIRADTVRGLRHGQGDLFREVCGNQPDLFHRHRLIQQIDISGRPVFPHGPVDPPGICDLPVYGLDRGLTLSFIPVCFPVPFPRQLIVITFQHDPGDHSAQFTDIVKDFFLQSLERYQFFFYNRFHHTGSFTCFVSQLTS